MTLEELVSLLSPIMPSLLLDEERDGEIIIFSSFKEDASGSLVGIPE